METSVAGLLFALSYFAIGIVWAHLMNMLLQRHRIPRLSPPRFLFTVAFWPLDMFLICLALVFLFLTDLLGW